MSMIDAMVRSFLTIPFSSDLLDRDSFLDRNGNVKNLNWILSSAFGLVVVGQDSNTGVLWIGFKLELEGYVSLFYFSRS